MDQRSDLEKALWDRIGPPLYYCADCLRAVKVTPVKGAEPLIERPCDASCGPGIIAPRKAIVAGKGGMNVRTRAKVKVSQLAAALTGRCV
jgi:hypothetical protein